MIIQYKHDLMGLGGKQAQQQGDDCSLPSHRFSFLFAHSLCSGFSVRYFGHAVTGLLRALHYRARKPEGLLWLYFKGGFVGFFLLVNLIQLCSGLLLCLVNHYIVLKKKLCPKEMLATTTQTIPLRCAHFTPDLNLTQFAEQNSLCAAPRVIYQGQFPDVSPPPKAITHHCRLSLLQAPQPGGLTLLSLSPPASQPSPGYPLPRSRASGRAVPDHNKKQYSIL